jgi:hypothetical protein
MDPHDADFPIVSTRSIMTPYGEQDENGTDLSLIRANFMLTPAERLLQSDRACRGTLQIIDYGRRHREKLAAADL